MVHKNAYVRPTILSAVIIGLVWLPVSAASAATYLDGPVDLGTAAPFSVLAGETVTNTGPSVLSGDLGLAPGTSITGFLPGTFGGTLHQTDAVAVQAQIDLMTAYNVAASLTPIATGLGDLTGSSLIPGVYSGGEVSVTGALTLEGTAESVWVFQAASTLTIGSGAIITVTGGASACNVFWQVSSSATLQTGAQFVGTVMAAESITAETAATITGRLLARNGAVTLDSNVITTPTGCTAGTVTISPEVTSSVPPVGTVGTPYSHTITASGVPSPTFAVTAGTLAPGLSLDELTGLLTGEPTTPGSYTFGVTVSNGSAPAAVVTYTVTVDSDSSAAVEEAAATLAEGGVDVGLAPAVAVALLLAGLLAVISARRAAMRR